MILTVTPNPALDMTFSMQSVVLGRSHRVAEGSSRAGGKGINAARVLHGLGYRTHALTHVGGVTGEEFRAEITEAEIPHTTVELGAATRKSITIVDDAQGESTVFNEQGSPLLPQAWTTFWETAGELSSSSSAVSINGSMPPEVSFDPVMQLISDLSAKGIPVLVDTSGPMLIAAAQAQATVLKPNEHELREATGCDNAEEAIRQLHECGAQIVLASFGEDGLRVSNRDGKRVRARFPERISGNATGAGDAVSAAALSLLSVGDFNLEHIARRCAAWGAAAVAMSVAGEVHADLVTQESRVQIS